MRHPLTFLSRRTGLYLTLLLLAPVQALALTAAQSEVGNSVVSGADFHGEAASADVREIANWAVRTGDNQGLGFILVDKRMAKVYVFTRDGRLSGVTTALLGLAKGDDSVPGIGQRRLATIRPEERTTPAGRYVAGVGRDLQKDVLWIDYDAALSLHRVVHGNPGDRRLERLASPSLAEKRISYGCINVPAQFYDEQVGKAFKGANAIVYILPEVKSLEAVFHMSRAGVDRNVTKAP
jgi:hypothetical protein